jgi:hypothetical protein
MVRLEIQYANPSTRDLELTADVDFFAADPDHP